VVLLCPGGEIGAAVALRGLFSSACPAPAMMKPN
jgi:phage baseplate assembly protein gpV